MDRPRGQQDQLTYDAKINVLTLGAKAVAGDMGEAAEEGIQPT